MTDRKIMISPIFILAGYVALLLWGIHMVTTGLLRSLGQKLQIWFETKLKHKISAFMAGIGVTVALQSSTATAMMMSNLESKGMVSLGVALSVLLGANVGTALVTQILSFNIYMFAPVVFLIGFVFFKSTKQKQIGRILMGVGLILIALHGLTSVLAPLETDQILKPLFNSLSASPLILLLIAGLLSWASHSSMATVLFISSLSQTGFISPEAGIAMVIGANLGSALNPILESGNNKNKRLPIGNFSTRMFGALLFFPFAYLIGKYFSFDKRLVVDFHLFFNIFIAMIFLLFSKVFVILIEKFVKVSKDVDEGEPQFLTEEHKSSPWSAITAGSREALRMAQMIEKEIETLSQNKNILKSSFQKKSNSIDRLGVYLNQFLTSTDVEIDDENSKNKIEVLINFSNHIRHLSSILKNHINTRNEIIKTGIELDETSKDHLNKMYRLLLDDIRLGISVIMNEDLNSIKTLLNNKGVLRELEIEAEKHHGLYMTKTQANRINVNFSALFLAILRDMRRINSHIVAWAYPINDRVQKNI